ncbi:MAG: SDR family NAD(P)-dependent oxidoreductase, partial [Pseudomonadota bacterium]|nr:SDR family NAD(P)-dependent oxidoreductase [Pseudomonadota bacterium]
MLEGKIALITGASRGIGAAIAERFAASGAKLALTAQTLHEVTHLSQRLRATYGSECVVHAGDVADSVGVEALYREVFARFGKLDVLAANAGILGDGLLGMLRQEDIERTISTNILGT